MLKMDSKVCLKITESIFAELPAQEFTRRKKGVVVTNYLWIDWSSYFVLNILGRKKNKSLQKCIRVSLRKNTFALLCRWFLNNK